MPAPSLLRSDARLPLREGDQGEAVFDLQQRLGQLQFDLEQDPAGLYGAVTRRVVEAFQSSRGLAADGVCDDRTWTALVEAGYRLGSRSLYRHNPMLRGDDVAELQRRLSALGFDPGRIDGIFGNQTAEALGDFQHNAGLQVDGICGPETLGDLLRMQLKEGPTDLVSPLRERIRVGTGGTRNLRGRSVGVGESGGFSAAVASVCRVLRETGANAFAIHHPDPSSQAAEANAAGVDCYLSLVLSPEQTRCTTAYYRGFQYESLASRRLAELIQFSLPNALGLENGGISGMSLPVLRETRMPAVEVQLGAPILVVQRISLLAGVLRDALSAWIEDHSD